MGTLGSRAPYARPMAIQRREPSRAATRVAGVLLLLIAAGGVAGQALLQKWTHAAPVSAGGYTPSVLLALLGLALIQGGSGARKAVLWLTGLGFVLLLLAVPAGLSMAPAAAKLIATLGGLSLLTLLGIITLVSGEERSTGAIVLGSLATLAGAAGTLAAEVWLLKAPERDLRASITEWAGSEPAYVDKSAGIELQLPSGWVLIRRDNTVFTKDLAQAIFGEPAVATYALLNYVDGERYMSVDHFLDTVLGRFQQKDPDAKQLSRVTVAVGQATGRQMRFTWHFDGLPLEGTSTAWQDGPTYFALSGWTTASLAPEAVERLRDLQAALKFDAPYATYAKSTIASVTEACPMLSKSAIESMIRTMPRTSITSDYFRMGYRWGMRGIGMLDSAAAQDVRSAMATVFASLPVRDRDRVGAYLERVRVGAPTSAGEDREMAEVMKAAIGRLPAEQLQKLRDGVEKAIEFGRLS